jgi:CBS domain-containing protein
MQARDVMTEHVVCVTPATPVDEVVGLMLRYHISAVPVVDAGHRVVGMLSEGDLLRPEGGNHDFAAERSGARERAWWLGTILAKTDGWPSATGETAGALMSQNVVSVTEDTPVNEIAATLERQRIKRVPVVRDGVIVGIVSRANLLHALANTIIDHHEPGAEKDREVRDSLVKALLAGPALGVVLINATVRDGAVQLWGTVDSAEQRAIAERIAKGVRGVTSVRNNLALGPMSGVPV